jgi:hypothetical protein
MNSEKLVARQEELRNRPSRPRRVEKKKKSKKRKRYIASPLKWLAAKQAKLEKAQQKMKEINATPLGRSNAARAAKGYAQAIARLTMKQELKAAKQMKRRLQLQRKRYKAHKAEFKNKVTHQMRDAWRATLAEWDLLRETIKIADSRLHRAVRENDSFGPEADKALAYAKGFKAAQEFAATQTQ